MTAGLMKRLLVMKLLTVATSQSLNREMNLLDAVLVDEAEESGVSVVEGSDGFPGFRFTSDSQVTRPFSKYLDQQFFRSFSLRADFRLDSASSGGFLFAILNPSQHDVLVGLEASGAGEKETNVSLHLSASPPAAGGSSVVSSFLIPVGAGSWTHLSMSVLEDSVSVYVDCELLETASLPLWNNHLDSDSVLYLGQAGTSHPRHLEGVIERLKLYEDAELAPTTCTTSFTGFTDNDENTSAELDPEPNLDDLLAGLFESKGTPTVNNLPTPPESQDEEEASGDVDQVPLTTQQPGGGDDDEAVVSPTTDIHQDDAQEKECCLIGLPGIPGTVGEKGERGPKGDTGSPGVAGSPAHLTDEDVERLVVKSLEQGRLSSLRGDPGLMGVQGVQGPPGQRGSPGQKGPPGPKGEGGGKGEPGTKGEKGDRGPPGTVTLPSAQPGSRGERGLPGVKGEKGRRGARGHPGPPATFRPSPPLPPVKGEKGEPGEGKVLLVTGPPGPPGLSIVGEKGEPGEDCMCYAPPSIRQGRLARPDAYHTQHPDHNYKIVPGAIIFPDLHSMAQMTEGTSVGTVAYLVSEQAVLVRMNSGWQYVALGGVVSVVNGEVTSPHRHSGVVSGGVVLPDKTHHRHHTPPTPPHSTSDPLQMDTPSLRLVALNEGYTGSMGGQRAVDLACYKQSKRAGLSGTFRAFLATSIQNLNSLVHYSDSSAPVVNIKGELLFKSWKEIFSGAGLAALKHDSAIYSFDGENVLTHGSWDEKYVWHGGAWNGELLADKQCEGWTSDSTHNQGSASSLSTGMLLNLPCSQRLAVLCIEVSASKDNVAARHSRHSPVYSRHRGSNL